MSPSTAEAFYRTTGLASGFQDTIRAVEIEFSTALALCLFPSLNLPDAALEAHILYKTPLSALVVFRAGSNHWHRVALAVKPTCRLTASRFARCLQPSMKITTVGLWELLA